MHETTVRSTSSSRIIAAGLPLNNPEVLFPKLDKDAIAALAELHLNGEAF